MVMIRIESLFNSSIMDRLINGLIDWFTDPWIKNPYRYIVFHLQSSVTQDFVPCHCFPTLD